MRITPLDARKQEFPKTFRGYDCDEVRAFLNTVADEYEAVLVDNKQLREYLAEREQLIRDLQAGGHEAPRAEAPVAPEPRPAPPPVAEVPAGPDPREIHAAAAREGERIVQDAHAKAQRVVAECRANVEAMRRELAGLHHEKETYLARCRSLADAQIQFVETRRTDFQDLDGRLMSIINGVLGGVGIAAVPLPAAGYDSPWCAPRPVPAPAPGAGPVAPVPGWYPQANGPAAAPGVPAAPADVWRDYAPPAPAPVGVGHPGTVFGVPSAGVRPHRAPVDPQEEHADDGAPARQT